MISCKEMPRPNSAINDMPCANNDIFRLVLIGYLLHDLLINYHSLIEVSGACLYQPNLFSLLLDN